MANKSELVEEFKMFNDEWRVNWTKNKVYIFHHHPKAVAGKEKKWILCTLDADECDGPPPSADDIFGTKGCRKRIHYSCRDTKCALKVPAGVVTVAISKRLRPNESE